ncbi:MAG: hypothetical protein MUC96_06135 [Myxococcaceae bacterium]|nr:hypothetical protein [Myxococcaceae bacterium]
MKTADAQPKLSQQLYQQLVGVMRGTWQSLVVMPASPGSSATAIAEALVEVARLARGAPAKLFVADGREKAGVSSLIVDMTQHLSSGGLAIVCVESVISQQSGVPIAMASDAALLVVHLGTTKVEDAENTIGIVGKQKFLGTITIESKR